MKKLLFLVVLAGLIALFFAADLDRNFSLQALQESQARFASLRATSPWLVGGAFMLVYVAMAALSLPGAAIMTLAGGALFGLVTGTVLVSFASSLGATLAFLASRYVLRDSVQRRFGDRLKAINDGMARDGAFYLFTLRLVPVFPFFLVNLLVGLTPIRTATYYWVSQIGMLPATIVYVNAGTQIGQLDSLAGILSPPLLLSFALLGIFPWMARAFGRFLARRRVYARWRRPRTFDRNLVVIGAGAAGLVSAYIAAAVKARVTLIEGHKMGGDCLNYGCVPSKALIRTAKLAHQIRHADHYGLDAATPRFSFATVMNRVRDVIRAIEPHDSVERYTKLGVEVLQGHATLKDPWTVELTLPDGSTRTLTTRSIVLATGARPTVPALPGLDTVDYVTSDTLWDRLSQAPELPARIAVLGGGPIGCELAQCLARLGARVTVVEAAPRLLVREDEEVSDVAREALERNGVTVLTQHEALRCERADGSQALVTRGAQGEYRTAFDLLLCAVGRTPRIEGYGLEQLGIPTARTVVTNDYLETLYPNIFAAGDVAGPYQFTHMAAHQAWYAAVNALFGRFRRFKVDYSLVPAATFIDPEIARVGLNEAEARSRGIAYETTRYGIDDLDRAIADGAAQGFIKVLTVPGKDRILGVTIVGEHAADLLAEYVLAMKHRLGLNRILGTVHVYPTLAEANKYVAGEWRRAHAPQKVLAWLERYHAWNRGR